MPESKDLSTIFIHIPKTAGTTVRSILEDCLPRERLYFLYLGSTKNPGMAEFEALTIEEKKKRSTVDILTSVSIATCPSPASTLRS